MNRRARTLAASMLGAWAMGACGDGRAGFRERGGEVERRQQAALFADIDTTLALAVEQAQLAALQASDVGLRAFAVQQVARYLALRDALRDAAVQLDAVPTQSELAQVDAARAEELVAQLRGVDRAHFDHLYVSYALALHRELLTGLDAALVAVEDSAARDAIGGLRDSLGATLPQEKPAPAATPPE